MKEDEKIDGYTYDSIKESAAYQAEKEAKFKQDLAIGKFKVLVAGEAILRARREKRSRIKKIIAAGKRPAGKVELS